MKKGWTPIENSAVSIVHVGSDYYYIRHIFNALREHNELLEAPDYKRLYDEAIDYLFRHAVEHSGWSEGKREWGYGWLEFFSDLENSHAESDEYKYSVETVNCLLEERRKIWNT